MLMIWLQVVVVVVVVVGGGGGGGTRGRGGKIGANYQHLE
jgi:hypothetical protein